MVSTHQMLLTRLQRNHAAKSAAHKTANGATNSKADVIPDSDKPKNDSGQKADVRESIPPHNSFQTERRGGERRDNSLFCRCSGLSSRLQHSG